MTDLPMTLERIQELLHEVYTKISPKGVEFLEARRQERNDLDALSITEISRSSVTGWKKKDDFSQAYWLITIKEPEAKRLLILEQANALEMEEAKQKATASSAVHNRLLVDDMDVHEIVRHQLDSLRSELPSVLERLFRIAKDGKDADALRAIKEIQILLDINAASVHPEELDEVKQRILDWSTIKVNE